MIGLFRFAPCVLASPFRSNLRLEAENAALRDQLIVLRRRPRGRVRLTNLDRLDFRRDGPEPDRHQFNPRLSCRVRGDITLSRPAVAFDSRELPSRAQTRERLRSGSLPSDRENQPETPNGPAWLSRWHLSIPS